MDKINCRHGFNYMLLEEVHKPKNFENHYREAHEIHKIKTCHRILELALITLM